MNGKSKCKILKDIRREIAKRNDIDLVIEDCKFKGDCLGTCPKCEAEVRYLEKEIEKRRALGKTVAVAGLVTTLAATSVSCDFFTPPEPLGGEVPYYEETAEQTAPQSESLPLSEPVLMGDVICTSPVSDGKFNFIDLILTQVPLEYAKNFTRNEIRAELTEYETDGNKDTYRVSSLGSDYVVTIEYDDEGIPVSVTVNEIVTPLTGDPAPTLMGAPPR